MCFREIDIIGDLRRDEKGENGMDYRGEAHDSSCTFAQRAKTSPHKVRCIRFRLVHYISVAIHSSLHCSLYGDREFLFLNSTIPRISVSRSILQLMDAFSLLISIDYMPSG